jgi:hypothetical protein
MARRIVHLHIGLPGAGSDFVATALARHAEALKEQGVLAPATADEMFRAALEITRTHRSWGLRRKDVEGAWAKVTRRVHKAKRRAVVGHELLAAARPDQIGLLLDGLAGCEVHVVIVAGDPGTALESGWSHAVAAGSPVSFARFRRRVLDPDRLHQQAHDFWAAHDLAAVLERWSAALGDPGRVHVVVPPSGDGDPRPAVWAVLAELVGFEPVSLTSTEQLELDRVSASVARAVNDAIDGRLDPRAHREVIRHHLGDGRPGLRALPSPGVYDDLVRVTGRWRACLAEGGYDVIGDPADLEPASPEPGGLHSAEPPMEERLALATDALADLMVETSRLRLRAAELESRNEKLEKKRRKLKKKLAQAG